MVNQCKKGNPNSIEWLYKKFYGYLMGVTLRYVSSREVAEELVNDSFMKIFRNIENFVFPQEEEHCSKMFRAWMARITSRTAMDYLRKPAPAISSEDISEFYQIAIQEEILTPMNVKDILFLLYELPDIQRLIFNLHEIEGYRHDEIAIQLGIDEKVSRVYLSRARQKLRILYHKKSRATYENGRI
jgi:RNA polymerase sigma factor (sigma-70 family)